MQYNHTAQEALEAIKNGKNVDVKGYTWQFWYNADSCPSAWTDGDTIFASCGNWECCYSSWSEESFLSFFKEYKFLIENKKEAEV